MYIFETFGISNLNKAFTTFQMRPQHNKTSNLKQHCGRFDPHIMKESYFVCFLGQWTALKGLSSSNIIHSEFGKRDASEQSTNSLMTFLLTWSRFIAVCANYYSRFAPFKKGEKCLK